jgi:hypothetical protein
LFIVLPYFRNKILHMNEYLSILLEICKYVLPSLVVFFLSQRQYKLFFEAEHRNRMLTFKKEQSKTLLPIQLQAYERCILLLERVSLDQLVVRVFRPELTVNQLKQALVQELQAEFNHNVSQQLYISAQSWELIQQIKQELLGLINITARELDADGSGFDLSKNIIEKVSTLSEDPTIRGLKFLKKEFELIYT